MLENNFEPDCKRLRFLLYTGRNVIQSQVGVGRYFIGIRSDSAVIDAHEYMIHFMFYHVVVKIGKILEFIEVS